MMTKQLTLLCNKIKLVFSDINLYWAALISHYMYLLLMVIEDKPVLPSSQHSTGYGANIRSCFTSCL